MIYTCKPERVSIYVNSGFKTIDQVQAETGADVIINGGLFNSNWTACCHLKADGKLIASDPWKYFGFGWHSGKSDLRLTSEYSDLDNYICCVCLIRNGQKEALSYPAELGGARQRTAIGVFPNGSIWFYASGEGKTPEALQNICYSLGLDSALMLDGGGSTQGICPGQSYRQTRKVHNFILAWLPNSCPYAEPTALQSRWSYTKEGAKWVQWHLNKWGNNLSVDGIIGGKTHAAIMAFQSDHGLTADGIVGNYTRAKLKQFTTDESPIQIIQPNYVWASTPSKRSTTSYIILHHAGVSTASAEAIHAYHKSLGWCGIGYNFYVRKNGSIYAGRPIDCIGAHTVGYNNKSVGICCEGNFEQEQMSEIQKNALLQIVKYCKEKYPLAKIKRHKDCDATACPGKNFPEVN